MKLFIKKAMSFEHTTQKFDLSGNVFVLNKFIS